MNLIFVHGWSVTDTTTYGDLPEVLAREAAAAGLDLDIRQVFLGRYVSFDDAVRMDDVVRAFDRALRDAIPAGTAGKAIAPFSCVTHSTGGPVVREWLHRYHGTGGARRLANSPLRHLIMLAPANHGSALAQLGKGTVGRLKALWEGVEPGVRILDWLELGSASQRSLNRAFLEYDMASTWRTSNPFFPCVLAGEKIDRKLYDFINSYTGEPGSDGVVRVAAANMNSTWLRLVGTDELLAGKQGPATRLRLEEAPRHSPHVAFRLVPDASHSGSNFGIMRSVTRTTAARKEIVELILRVLGIDNATRYQRTIAAFERENTRVQAGRKKFSMVVFHLEDDQGAPIDDFDLILLAGPGYDPNRLPKGFFQDRQRNRKTPNVITYYVNHGVMMRTREQAFGFRVHARPARGLVRFHPSEFHSDGLKLGQVLRPNQTLHVDLVLKRRVDIETARLDPATDPRRDFRGIRPANQPVD